ncbi:MAG: hypothetical protein Q9218_008006 [Villophora microphyllina]
MDTTQSDYDVNAENSIEFDQLCHMCVSLFDEKVTWEKDWENDDYRLHHDIFSLTRSAAGGCLVCSLILGQVTPENVKRLQQDLAELVTHPSWQIGISIYVRTYRMSCATLRIAARGNVLTDDFYRSADEKQGGWFAIGELLIQFEEDDYTNATRSKAFCTCSDASIAQITEWMGQCITTHEKCLEIQTLAATRDVLPKRLLDLSSAAKCGRVRLVPTATMPQDTLYITLSHCWGGNCPTTLSVDNVRSFEDGVEMSILPRTFQDAIMITTKLSVQYLWIDALCIVQDSPDDTEWRHEASIMGDIYANSSATLAATTSENSNGGLLYRRNPLSIWPCRVVANWTCFKPGRVVVSVDQMTHGRNMKPLEDRAWAFQEWLLSKRLIHFSHDQVRWECYCLAASELYPQGLDEVDEHNQGLTAKRIIINLSNKGSAFHALWEWIRMEYSAKRLTKATDKLTAFSGIARMVHKVLKSAPEDYCAGLWRPKLLTELLWERYGDHESDRPSGVYIAPTWSWASLNGRFWRPWDVSKRGHWLVNVIETRIQHVEDIFGPVNSGCLVVRGRLCHVTLTVVERNPRYPGNFHWKLTHIDGAYVNHISSANLDYHQLGKADLAQESSCYFMPMREDQDVIYVPSFFLQGLLLKPTESLNGQYYRIGLLIVRRYNGDPEFTVSMAQGRDLRPEKFGINDQDSGFRVIEIV